MDKLLILFLKKTSIILLLIILAVSNVYSQDMIWTKIKLPSTSNLAHFLPDAGGGIIAIFKDNVLYQSSNSGNTWVPISILPFGLSPLIITPSDEIIGAYSLYTGSIQISNDFGLNWKETFHYSYGYQINSIFFNPNNSGIYLNWYDFWDGVGNTKLSLDNGKTWSDYSPFYTLASSPWLYLKDSTIIAKDTNRIYYSTNNGLSWSNTIYDSLNFYFFIGDNNSLKIAADSISNIYVITQNYGVFFSKFNQWNWKNIGLKNSKLSSIAISGNKVYVSSDTLGVFKLNSNDTTWSPVNTGLNNLNIVDIFMERNGILYARTDAELYRINILTNIRNNTDKNIKSFRLSQNYPNPFNPSTSITYQLPKAGMVELKVYDILGRAISTLVNKYENAGSHSVQFNSNNMPSGVYLYKIKAGDYSASRKMILLK